MTAGSSASIKVRSPIVAPPYFLIESVPRKEKKMNEDIFLQTSVSYGTGLLHFFLVSMT